MTVFTTRAVQLQAKGWFVSNHACIWVLIKEHGTQYEEKNEYWIISVSVNKVMYLNYLLSVPISYAGYSIQQATYT